MENYKYKTLVALLLISKGKPLNNSFKVTKFLESIYETKDSHIVLSEIRKLKYVDFYTKEGIDHYTLTSLGREFIEHNYDEGKNYLLETYSKVAQITQPLFDNYLDPMSDSSI